MFQKSGLIFPGQEKVSFSYLPVIQNYTIGDPHNNTPAEIGVQFVTSKPYTVPLTQREIPGADPGFHN